MGTNSTLPSEYYDEKTGLHYTLAGDYFYPELAINEESYTPGIWAKRRMRFLKEHRHPIYTTLVMSGELDSHLRNIDEKAETLLDDLTSQMMEREGVDESLKERDQMRWAGLVNSINHRAREIVNSTLIFA